MRVLIVNTFDIKGGAARAAYRLHKGLKRSGVASAMLVLEKFSQDKTVKAVAPLPADDHDAAERLKIFNAITKNYIKKNRTGMSNAPYFPGYPGYDLSKTKLVEEADVINLHWVAKYQSVETISALSALGKPIVWTLHDEHPFTGGCHYSAGCTLYESDCHTCPQLIDDPYKLPHHSLLYKEECFRGKNITVVSPSRWLADLAARSRVFKEKEVVTIPNSLEIDIYTPRDKRKAKKKAGIPGDCLTILTGAADWKPKRKGFAEFLSTMKHCLKNEEFSRLVKSGKLLLICFGTAAEEMKGLNIPFKAFGKVDADKEISTIYNAADIFVMPSVEDNLPNTILESMACATPVTAFAVGGMPDMIEDGINGLLAPLRDTEKMAQAVLELIFHTEKRERMGRKGRETIETHYKLEDQARAYTRLFSRLIPGGGSTAKKFTIKEEPICPVDKSFNKRLLPLYREYSPHASGT